MSIKISQITFLERSKLEHGERYIYNNAFYKGFGKYVIITCLIHGSFEILPEAHWRGAGCEKCEIDCKNKIIDEYFINNYDKIKRNSNYITCYINTDLACLQCNNVWSQRINYKNLATVKCKKCDGKALTNERIDEFLIKTNKPIKRIGNYKRSTAPIDWQCLICNNIWNSCSTQIMRKRNVGGNCVECKKIKNIDIDKFIEKNNLKIKRINNCSNSRSKINWQCLDCKNIWIATPSNVMRGTSCTDCARSKNEKIVRNFLKENNIEIQKIKIKLPINKTVSRPDFYIPSLNLIIEYNGAQHYRPIRFCGINQERANINFEYQKIRDEQLRKYCKLYNINLLEIDGRKYRDFKLIKYLNKIFNNKRK